MAGRCFAPASESSCAARPWPPWGYPAPVQPPSWPLTSMSAGIPSTVADAFLSAALSSCGSPLPSSGRTLCQTFTRTQATCAFSGEICTCYYVSFTFVLDLDLLRSFLAAMISQACRVPAQGEMTLALSCWIMSSRLFFLASSRLIATAKTGTWLFSERWVSYGHKLSANSGKWLRLSHFLLVF